MSARSSNSEAPIAQLFCLLHSAGHQASVARISVLTIFLLAIVWISQVDSTHAQETSQPKSSNEPESAVDQMLRESCSNCHTGSEPSGKFSIEQLRIDKSTILSDQFDPTSWERMLRRIRAGQMPPAPRDPDQVPLVEKGAAELESLLGQRGQLQPRAHPPQLRRLTRTEYQNCVHDLLGLKVDASTLLPRDESSHGFDNVTVTELTPAFIGRAVTASQLISRQVLGIGSNNPAGVTVRVPANRTQEAHEEGLPLGTRGGLLLEHNFLQSGVYEFQIRLARDRDEKVEGLSRDAQMDVLIDRRPMHRFEIPKPANPADHTLVDAHLKVQLQVAAGEHAVGVTFPQTTESILEYRKQPFQAAYNHHRHPRVHPAVYEVTIVGPLSQSIAGIPDTPATRKLFGDLPRNPPPADQAKVAEQLLARVARMAYRCELDEKDLARLMKYFHSASERGFSAGLELALASILVSPNFLLKIEEASLPLEAVTGSRSTSDHITSTPRRQSSTAVVPVSDTELASRMSFFLWSSLPDERLLELAQQRELSEQRIRDNQVVRMLEDHRSEALINNFAAQWLQLRNLDSLTPDLRLYTDFDDNLKQAMRFETEALLRHVIGNDLSVLELLRTDYTFLNERLAAHYDIQGVLGSQMRRVDLPAGSQRGGLLRHASILSVTSYATRTSPSIRGNWILTNVIGTPPPPPPPNVPALKESAQSQPQTTRQRLDQHRQNPACASCHDRIDPLGFALENYDALGRWRTLEFDRPIESTAVLPDGTPIESVGQLEQNLLLRPEAFVGTMVEKLMTFALGHGIEPADEPIVRQIVQQAKDSDYRFSAIIRAIVSSPLFLQKLVDIQASSKR